MKAGGREHNYKGEQMKHEAQMRREIREKRQGESRARALGIDPMQKLIFVWALLSVFLLTQKSWAQDISLGEVALGGTGCAQGNAEALVEETESGSDVKIQFYSFAVEKEGSGLKRAACSVALPIKVAKGKRIEVSGASALSLIGVEAGDRATIASEIFLAGEAGQQGSVTIHGPKVDYDLLQIPAKVVSKCGDDVILRANSSVILRNTSGLYGFALIDHLALHVQVSDC